MKVVLLLLFITHRCAWGFTDNRTVSSSEELAMYNATKGIHRGKHQGEKYAIESVQVHMQAVPECQRRLREDVS